LRPVLVWYASVLLRQIEPAHRPVVYPRKHQSPGTDWSSGPVGESIREYAKKGLKSGQGEVLSFAEMQKVIEHFGYQCEASSAGGNRLRETFISRSLAANRPVLFAYTKGNIGPVNALTATGTAGSDYGSHWSLIIKEESGNYTYLDPHDPNTPEVFPKALVLTSNANVDAQKYCRYWAKARPGDLQMVGSSAPIAPAGTFIKIYDINQGGRDQVLKNVLIAVF
jgi:hypothetical protein